MSVLRFIVIASCLFLSSCELSTLGANSAGYASFELQWQAPQARENGESLNPSELSGYELVYRAKNTRFYEPYARIDANKTSIRITDIPAGIYEFRIAAIDNNGLYSNFSEPTVVDANQSGDQAVIKSGY